MSEGSLEAPIRRPIQWQEEAFTNPEDLDAELRRVFDICHGCRRCFNLCDAFPRLFDLIDSSETGELDSVGSTSFRHVADACTLCDMCFMTKCPYVPPHEFDLDFPHLMLRYRAMEFKRGNVSTSLIQLTETDRNGKLASFLAPFVNWFTSRRNKITRFIMEILTGVDRNSELPKYHHKTFGKRDHSKREINGPATTRKAILYSTCFINYNNPSIGEATQKVLSNHGVKTKILYPSCCGMPQLEQGDISRVADNARKITAELLPWVDNGYDVIALVPSCSLMLKFEWPLILPENQDIKKLSNATFDVSEYIMDMARQKQLRGGLKKIEGGVTVHLACHSRAQNMGPKAADMLRLIPDTEVVVVDRCSGHGGSWGIMKSNFETALRVGQPVANKAVEANHSNVVSECPLAREHIVQGMNQLGGSKSGNKVAAVCHPIEILAKSYGLQ